MQNTTSYRIKGSLGDIPIHEEYLNSFQMLTMNRAHSKRKDSQSELIRVECRLPQTAVFNGEMYNHQLKFQREIDRHRMDNVKEILVLQSAHEQMMAAFRSKRFEAPVGK